MDQSGLPELLRRDGVVGAQSVITPLPGGVSSDIVLVQDGESQIVVKGALEKLKVRDDWRADPARNRHEQQYLKYVGSLLPKSVPKILFANEEHAYFGMEYFGEGFTNWKTALLQGTCDPSRAKDAMSLLATIHSASRDRADLAAEFDTTNNFHQLRTDPYLLTAARRNPSLADIIETEAKRLDSTHECLVHGDFSPKNILLGENRLIILDCEVAWYGDPAFDIAFFLNHLCLKGLYHAPKTPGLEMLFNAAIESYFSNSQQRSGSLDGELDRRTARLLLTLLLARIDGKSPVEYLTAAEKNVFVREFVSEILPGFSGGLRELGSLWFARLAHAALK